MKKKITSDKNKASRNVVTKDFGTLIAQGKRTITTNKINELEKSTFLGFFDTYETQETCGLQHSERLFIIFTKSYLT